MPNKKKTVLQREEELAQRIMLEVNAGIEARFEKFERVMERMAGAAEHQPSPPRAGSNNKRTADDDPQGTPPPNKVSKPNNSNPSLAYSHSTLSNNETVPVVDLAGTPGDSVRQSAQAPPRHPSDCFAEQPHSLPPPSLHVAMSTNTCGTRPTQPVGFSSANNDSWAAWSAAHTASSANNLRPAHLPTSTHEVVHNDALDSHVKQILATTVHNLGKGNSQPFDFPYKYILRGPEKIKATINSVTLPEHLWGIFRIMHDPKTEAAIKPSLMIHIEQIVEDAREFDWELGVRRWSKEVFSRISEGRLVNGWQAYDKIQRMRMVIAQSKPMPSKQQSHNTYKDNFNKRQHHQSQAQQDILKGGPPCPDYNSPSGCTLNSGHIKQGKRMVHVCSFCLQHTSAANYHPEPYCRNKVRITGSNTHFQ